MSRFGTAPPTGQKMWKIDISAYNFWTEKSR